MDKDFRREFSIFKIIVFALLILSLFYTLSYGTSREFDLDTLLDIVTSPDLPIVDLTFLRYNLEDIFPPFEFEIPIGGFEFTIFNRNIVVPSYYFTVSLDFLRKPIIWYFNLLRPILILLIGLVQSILFLFYFLGKLLFYV